MRPPAPQNKSMLVNSIVAPCDGKRVTEKRRELHPALRQHHPSWPRAKQCSQTIGDWQTKSESPRDDEIDGALGFRLAEVLAAAFVLHQGLAGPEEVNEIVFAGEIFYGFLEAGNDAALDAEDVEKLVPEGLLFGLLAAGGVPFPGKRDGAVANFVPGKRHRSEMIAEERGRALQQSAGGRGTVSKGETAGRQALTGEDGQFEF